jgi:2-keto-4-pentenoate hydratase/2-oxohepta-3-ene-1,7-dioic acid hydratase in catechol pathway
MSQGTTLPAGGIIITGTPSGIGNGRIPRVCLKDGDVVCCSISHGIGSLVNSIVYERKSGGV